MIKTKPIVNLFMDSTKFIKSYFLQLIKITTF